MLTILVLIAMTQGYFAGADIRLYLKMDLALVIIIAVLWIRSKIKKRF